MSHDSGSFLNKIQFVTLLYELIYNETSPKTVGFLSLSTDLSDKLRLELNKTSTRTESGDKIIAKSMLRE